MLYFQKSKRLKSFCQKKNLNNINLKTSLHTYESQCRVFVVCFAPFLRWQLECQSMNANGALPPHIVGV